MNEVQEQYKNEALQRAEAFTLLVRSQAWVLIRAYIENTIQSFTNKAVKTGFKDMEEYQFERGRVDGLTALLSHIDSDLKILEDEAKGSTAK